jgi:ubiquinone/menaquinone biosynthesis C-methylase UbiE
MNHNISEARKVIENDWSVSPYYDEAEGQISVFWSDDLPFLPLFRELDLTNCVELACGHGRHTAQVLQSDRQFTLIDINQSNIDYCLHRFAGQKNVRAIKNDGSTLPLVGNSVTSLFCYDAMVHFELQDVMIYLAETYRVLVSGGKALFHFSNYDKAPGGSYHDNPHWRNFNSAKIFQHLAVRIGFEILDIKTLHWGGALEIDAVALLRKP